MFSKIKWNNKPPYFYDVDYDPDLPLPDKAFHARNLTYDYLPNIRQWIYDQLELYAVSKLRNKSRLAEVRALCKTIRWYDQTVVDVDPFTTVVTQLYVCELLATLLTVFFDSCPTPRAHGYKWKALPSGPMPLKDLFLMAKKAAPGLAFDLHNLFYQQPLMPEDKGRFPSLVEYLKFIPEIRIDFDAAKQGSSRVIRCGEQGYRATCAHPDPNHETYHYIANLENDELLNIHRDEISLPQLFPELANFYTIANHYGKTPVSSSPFSDEMISTTEDVNGECYGLGFGGSAVQKQRDIEIRFYIMFVLGSLGRYNPDIWSTLPEREPVWYFFVRRFLEHNQILFPLLALRYMTGRGFKIGSAGHWR